MSQLLVYSTDHCGDCTLARRVLRDAGVAYREIDIEREPEAARVVMKINGGMRSVPTILFPDGSVLVEPSARVLSAKLEALGLVA